MKSILGATVLLGLALALNGCGGSSSSSGGTPTIGASKEFQANLPDGSSMVLEVFTDSAGVWSGEFAVAAETGPYAHQVGSFEGTDSGSSVTAVCETSDGTQFTISGTKNGAKSYQLTRSDVAGTVLTFLPVTASAGAASRADTSFNLNVGGTSGQVTVSTTPASIQGGGTMYEYRGTWQGVPATFWSYTSGYATVVLYVDPFAIDTVSFLSYKLTDFPTATKDSSSARVTVYSTVTKSQFRFDSKATASP